MKYKVFYPKPYNLIPSAILTFLSWLFIYMVGKKGLKSVRCFVPSEGCIKFAIRLFPEHCGCYTSQMFWAHFLQFILIPFIFIYVIASTVKLISNRK